MYDILGILFLISVGTIILLIPVAIGGLVVWAFEKFKPMLVIHRRT
ncbi:MAG TPA: hypothetical protein VGK99_05905 [Acidobacteriota bacterium]|jgi:hypothetical protein